MKISSSFNSNYRAKNRQSFGAIPTNPVLIPEIIGRAGKWAGEYVSMPEQKLFLAASALLFQPAIDMKYAEKDKKADVAIKSASKAIAGGITGVTIRAGFEKFFLSKIGYTEEGVRKANSINDIFFPPSAAEIYEKSPSEALNRLKSYSSTLGIMAALIVMIFFTNSKIDVPLTSDLQDLFNGVSKNQKSWAESFNDVKKARLGKINKFFDKNKAFFKRVANKTKKIINIIKEDDTGSKKTKETKENAK